MVSLKKYLDSHDEQVLAALVDSYQRLLSVTATCNTELCTQSAGDLAASLRLLEQAVSSQSRPADLIANQKKAELHLHHWRDRTTDYLRQKTAEMKELLMVVAHAAESIGERDHSHTQSLQGLTRRLQAIAELEDITRLRTSLLASVEEMSQTVQQMSRDSAQTQRALEVQVANYRSRLEQTEQEALLDPLTGLANRRRIEADLNLRILRATPFAVLLIDLNNFKQINDRFGHLAGDQLLHQFASELRQSFRQCDLVGRWGGDEFLVLVSGQVEEAQAARSRIEQYVWGVYTLTVSPGKSDIKVDISASIGIAAWQPGLSSAQVVEQADQAMYEQKAAR